MKMNLDGDDHGHDNLLLLPCVPQRKIGDVKHLEALPTLAPALL